MQERAQLLLEIADDELILGWRDSEWTGIAPFLEEDVAFSSIAQNEIGHARALYELVARELGTTADELAFDRAPEEYRCARLVELRLPSWEHTIARHHLYEEADAIRLERLKASDDSEVAGLAAKIDREEVYHRIHAEMWVDRLLGSPRRPRRLRAAHHRHLLPELRELRRMAVPDADERSQLVEGRDEARLVLEAVEPHLRVHPVVDLLAVDLRGEACELGVVGGL